MFLCCVDGAVGSSCGPQSNIIKKSDGTTECFCPECSESSFDQVCGSDGITYGNECELRSRSCKIEREISVMKTAPCGMKFFNFCILCGIFSENGHLGLTMMMI